jgi:hypothetical protein
LQGQGEQFLLLYDNCYISRSMDHPVQPRQHSRALVVQVELDEAVSALATRGPEAGYQGTPPATALKAPGQAFHSL